MSSLPTLDLNKKMRLNSFFTIYTYVHFGKPRGCRTSLIIKMSSPYTKNFENIFWNVDDKLIVFFYSIFYIPENIQAMLNKHIPVVTRSLTKIMNHLEDLQSVADYLELLGKIHHQSGIQVREINISYYSSYNENTLQN